MAGRTRTAKALAQRIDLNYFKRLHPFRRWKLILSMAVPAAVLLWLGGNAAGGSKAPYSSGPVSASHRVFENRCERCHVTQARAFRAHVTDNMCASCHDAPAHKSNQTFTPTCASCHVEHRGAVRLAATADRECEQCHRDLSTTTGRLTVAKTVGALNDAHPEFAATRLPTEASAKVGEGSIDRAVLRFNHEVHVKPGLRGPEGATQLECTTCHSPALRSASPSRSRPTDDMAAVTYAKDCASCHPLFFDPLIDAMAPHDVPEKVRAMVTQSLREFIAKNPAQIGRPDPVRGRIPVNFPEPMRPAANAAEWLDARTETVERLLWSKTCAECHAIDGGVPTPGLASRAPALPRVVPTSIPTAWMPHARFDHAAHQMTGCTSCHDAQRSRLTSDVLMPAIATCQQCHKPSRGAESRCFECHQYHDWKNAKPARPGFTLDELVN